MARSLGNLGALLLIVHGLASLCVCAFVPCELVWLRRQGPSSGSTFYQQIAARSRLPAESSQLSKQVSNEHVSSCGSEDSASTRRIILLSAPAAAAATAATLLTRSPLPSSAVETSSSVLDLVTGQADVPQLENGLLESRVLENGMSPPPYGMEGQDVYYPEWFGGSWKVKSFTTDIQAPCGPVLFGGNATFASARNEIGTFLEYESRFILDGNDHVVADREFNVKSIAKVAMGTNSVVDVSLASPNKFSCLLSPKGSPSLLKVELVVLNRRQENVDKRSFHCSEVVREIIFPVGDSKAPSRPQSPLLKEIETASLYRLVSAYEVRCLQRSATFLLPSQQDPMAMKMWEISRGRPTDVRFYDVVYTKR